MCNSFTTPKQDGFSMPAEFARHHGTLLIWPERLGSWRDGAQPAREAFAQVIAALSRCEQVYVLVNARTAASARAMLPPAVHFLTVETDDAWARDVAPTFVRHPNGTVRGIDWAFNAWGGSFDGLYADWARDDAVAKAVCDAFACPRYDAHPFVLEGGAIHSDGEGTVLVTEACLLSKGRNPDKTKAEITACLLEMLGAEQVIWLPHGIYQDETNEHIDNVCAFLRPGTVCLAWCDRPDDPQTALSRADEAVLRAARDAKGRALEIVRLPVPTHPVCVQAEELSGYAFAEGEAERAVGERLAASYVNFYFGNDCILVPQFGGENAESDAAACAILAAYAGARRVIPIPAREILLGGGNIHCITQQIPEGRMRV